MNDSKAPNEADAKSGIIHEVDGIKELDNQLPNWWLQTLFGTILFGVGYYYWYQTSGIGKLPRAEFDQAMDLKRAEEAKKILAAGKVTDESLQLLVKDKGTLEQGKDVFTQTCVACHRQDGGGNVGPNLTDAFWLHGGKPEAIYNTINQGVPDKGMPAWGPSLGINKTLAVSAYIVTLRGTNAPGGKAPQGVEEKAP